MYGDMLEWMVSAISDLVHKQKSLLPQKAVDDVSPQIYWSCCPPHNNFDPAVSQAHSTFNACLESVVKPYDNMRVIKLKEIWNSVDSALVSFNSITNDGLDAYWRAVDKAIKFNVEKWEIFLARQILKKHNIVESSRYDPRDPMPYIFSKRKKMDRFHWSKDKCQWPHNVVARREQSVHSRLTFERMKLPSPP